MKRNLKKVLAVVLTLVMTVLWFVSARKLNSFAGDNIYVVEYATPES